MASPADSSPPKRILLKLSGESLAGGAAFGIAPRVLKRIVGEIAEVWALGVQVALVVGGGNLFRGSALKAAGMTGVVGDQMGMLATVMNAIALRDAFECHHRQLDVRLLSAIHMPALVESYNLSLALRYLEERKIVIFAAGLGNPLFTTDTAACLRGIEIGADIVLKATKVDGVYTDDPMKVPDAKHIPVLSYQEALDKQYAAMDQTALTLCRHHAMEIRVFNMNTAGALLDLMHGKILGTIIKADVD